MSGNAPYRVLCIEGGGMRGYYSAAYLAKLADLGEKRHGFPASEFGRKFDMIVGTSTGAIVGTGLAAHRNLEEILGFYRSYGRRIFPRPMAKSLSSVALQNRPKLNRTGTEALREGLTEAFGETTLGQLYKQSGIALVIPAVNASTHKGWVFKTPHNADTNHRDDNYTLVDVCLATSAAPIYRSLAAVKQPGRSTAVDLFVDGGLWGNNPVLVSLSEALRVTDAEREIEIFCLGPCSPPPGSVFDHSDPHWGFGQWRFGATALTMSLDAQSGVHEYLAKSIVPFLRSQVSIVRFPEATPSASQAGHLELDSCSKQSLALMRQLASTAFDTTNNLIRGDTTDGRAIASLLRAERPHDHPRAKTGT